MGVELKFVRESLLISEDQAVTEGVEGELESGSSFESCICFAEVAEVAIAERLLM